MTVSSPTIIFGAGNLGRRVARAIGPVLICDNKPSLWDNVIEEHSRSIAGGCRQTLSRCHVRHCDLASEPHRRNKGSKWSSFGSLGASNVISLL